jgi:hypothetical protein
MKTDPVKSGFFPDITNNLIVGYQLGNDRMISANRATFAAFEFHRSEIHVQGLEDQHPVCKQLTGSGQKLQHFRCLYSAQYSGN